MISALPNNKSMWMRAFYGFGPEHDGYVGWSREVARDRILREIRDGDLILIYGSGSVETEKTLRSYVLGFVQVDAKAIRDVDKSSSEAMQWKIDKAGKGGGAMASPCAALGAPMKSG